MKDEIVAAEQRLGVTLPPSDRSFLPPDHDNHTHQFLDRSSRRSSAS
jgi:hypothetical protein